MTFFFFLRNYTSRLYPFGSHSGRRIRDITGVHTSVHGYCIIRVAPRAISISSLRSARAQMRAVRALHNASVGEGNVREREMMGRPGGMLRRIYREKERKKLRIFTFKLMKR